MSSFVSNTSKWCYKGKGGVGEQKNKGTNPKDYEWNELKKERMPKGVQNWQTQRGNDKERIKI